MANAESVGIRPGPGFAIFAQAEKLGMTVHKYLSGRDGPLLNVEWVLLNTYHLARQKFEREQEKKQGKGKGKRR